MKYIDRTEGKRPTSTLARGRSVLLLGARQAGKTTLAQCLNPDLQTFLREHGSARHGLVVCRKPRRYQLARNIVALPWQEMPAVIDEFLA